MTPNAKAALSFLGSFLTAIVLASFFSIQSTSLQVARLEEKIEAIRNHLSASENRQRETEERIRLLEAKK